jgi:transcriptional regulator with XRE-family HTH domain
MSLKITADELKKERKRLGFTQKQFATWLGYSASAVETWESRPNAKIPDAVVQRLNAHRTIFQPKFTLEEYGVIAKKAEAAGMSIEDFVRKALAMVSRTFKLTHRRGGSKYERSE